MALSAQIIGLEELSKKTSPDALLAKPVRDALSKAAIIVSNKAKENATGRPGPRVRTGRLRQSISYQIDSAPMPAYAKVGTNVFYAPFLEYGTSRMQPYPFLEPALESEQGKIDGLLKDASKAMERHWQG